MPYPHPIKIDGLLAKEEAVYGTDPTPTIGDNGVRVVGRLWPQLGDEFAFPNERGDVAIGSLDEPIPAVPRGHMINLDFTVELKGAGAAYSGVTPIVRPEVDPLLVASGLARTHDNTSGAETVSYAPADTGHLSCTIWAYAGGKLYKIVGCRGNMLWDMAAGELGRLRFVMQGMVASIAETAQASITYDSAESPAVIAMALAISGWSPNFSAASLDLGNEVVRLDDGNEADGLEGFFIGDRKMRFTLSARGEDFSTVNPNAIHAARTIQTIATTLGSVQYNQAGIAVTDARIWTAPTPVEDNRFAGWDIVYQVRDLALLFD